MWAGWWKISSVASKSTKYRLHHTSGIAKPGSGPRQRHVSPWVLWSRSPASYPGKRHLRRHPPSSRTIDITGVPGSDWSAHHETDVQPTGSGSGIGEGHFGSRQANRVASVLWYSYVVERPVYGVLVPGRHRTCSCSAGNAHGMEVGLSPCLGLRFVETRNDQPS